jgi:hypothetical protein
MLAWKWWTFTALVLSNARGQPKNLSDARDFHSSMYFSNRTIASTPSLFVKLDEYVSQHGIDTLNKEKDYFCQRYFVVATYACPQAIGNHLVAHYFAINQDIYLFSLPLQARILECIRWSFYI